MSSVISLATVAAEGAFTDNKKVDLKVIEIFFVRSHVCMKHHVHCKHIYALNRNTAKTGYICFGNIQNVTSLPCTMWTN
jgi:hypothetical protein